MIGGAPFGTSNIGSFNGDNFVYGVTPPAIGLIGAQIEPSYSFSITAPALGVAGSAVNWAVVSFTVPPALGLGSAELEAEVIGSISFDINPPALALGVPTIESEVILEGVPDFFVTRSGTDVTITVSNRENRTIRLFRADNHNTSFALVTTFATDVHVDTVPSATLNYKYKLAFTINLTPPIIATRSISKFTKHD